MWSFICSGLQLPDYFANPGERTAFRLIYRVALHLERRSYRFWRLSVDCGALEDALGAVCYRRISKKLPQCNLENGIAPCGISRVGGRGSVHPADYFQACGNFPATAFLVRHAKSAMAQNARQIVVEMPLRVGIVTIRRHYAADRNKRLLDYVVRVERWEALVHVRLHHRTVASDKLAPANVLRIIRQVAQQCC